MAETISNANIVIKSSNIKGKEKKNHALITMKASTAVETREITNVQEQAKQRQSPSPLQENGSDTTLQQPMLNDDESNPQQGEQQQHKHHYTSRQYQNLLSTTTRPTVTAIAASSTTKVPPTIKDYRKIFVGGLPSDGKQSYA